MTVAGLGQRFFRATRSVVVDMWHKNALVDASAMAFSLFLASIPLLALAGLVVAEILAGEPRALAMVSSLVDAAPGEVRGLVSRHLRRGVGQSAAPLFLAGSLWLAAGAFHDAMTVFEGAVGATPRSWPRKRLIAIGCVVALLALLVVAGWLVVALAGGPIALLDRAEEVFPRAVAVVLAGAAALVILAAFFRVAIRHRTRHPPLFPGALTTVTIGFAASYAFATYSRTLASYAVFYGSLAAVAVFLLWLWICCSALLVGVEVNAHIERQRSSVPPPSRPGPADHERGPGN